MSSPPIRAVVARRGVFDYGRPSLRHLPTECGQVEFRDALRGGEEVELLDKATEIDDKYGTRFKPPVR